MSYALEANLNELVKALVNIANGNSEVFIERDVSTGTKIKSIYVRDRDKY